jgi:hypothetical protein
MSRLIAAWVLALAVAAVPAFAADDASKTADSKPVKAVKSLDAKKGAFHIVHERKAKLACEDCHSKQLKDVLFLRGAETSAPDPGPVDRNECIDCHQAPEKPVWYGAKR